MANPKRILVVCGTGIVTAKLVAERVKTTLKERGIPVATCVCHIDDAAQKAGKFQPDCVISTAYLNGCLPFPVFRGLPFLTGVKEEEALSKIVNCLREPAQSAL